MFFARPIQFIQAAKLRTTWRWLTLRTSMEDMRAKVEE